MRFEGKAHKYGDNIDTDVILPGPYMNISDPQELGRHALEGIDPEFVRKVSPGDILVVGRNFGCGSSREHAPIALKAAGVACIIAAGFARIFFRNAINIGLPIVVAPEAAFEIQDGVQAVVDIDRGEICADARVYAIEPLPAFIQELVGAGGLHEFVRQRLASGAAG